MAAEISPRPEDGPPRRPRFNEAAANGRGNLAGVARGAHADLASMRPRRMAAEIIHVRADVVPAAA